MVAHRGGMNHSQQQQLIDHIERSGARVMGYVPENTLVVVGSPDALTQATNHPAIMWWGHHEPEYKMDPDWETLLPAIEALSSGDLNEELTLSTLPVRIERQRYPYSKVDILLVGIRVHFPVSWHPAPLPRGHEAEGAAESRAQRVREERGITDLAMASATDWAPLLRQHAQVDSIEIHSGGPSSIVVLSPPQALRAVLGWLAERPAVRWISPLARHARRNHQGTVITQAARAAPQNPGASGNLDADIHPIWNAGITGGGQIIGQGDSGIDYNHCFFVDPNVNFTQHISIVGGVLQFDSTTHRKLRMYRAYADFQDANGHGTHTAGTLAGIPYGTSIDADGAINIGNAPDAKIAFIDLSSAANGDSITTPYDLGNGYFKYTTAVGAYIHSDSWGSNAITYDSESVQVDGYVWENPNFLPVFPAGNDGTAATPGQTTGSSTVNSPATSKNCIAAGATQTAGQLISPSTLTGTTWAATIKPQVGGTNGASGSTGSTTTGTISFIILQSSFSPGFSSLTSSSSSYPIVAASPLQACSSLSNLGGLAGSVVLVERGNCTYLTKAQMAAAAGAVACIIFDDVVESYFIASSPNSQTVSIPVATIPRQSGQSIMAFLSSGHAASISFGDSSSNPLNNAGYDNLAVFSSKGPVGPDLRIKPDLVAPGLLTSALTGSPCGTVTYGGTSMATPTIAGSAALVRQYFQSGFYPSGIANASAGFTPTGALIKAVLIAGATSLGGFEADTGLPVPAPPSYSQGYGRVFLGQSLYLQGNPYSPQKLAVLDAVPIAGGDVHQFCITATGGPLSIALVWSDYPGDPTAVYSLVNNLDLVVRAEGFNGQPLLGNGGGVKDASVPDQSNNVEVVSMEAFPPGKVSIQVLGTTVQALTGGQHYSLVVNGNFQGALAMPSSSSSSSTCSVVTPKILSAPPHITNQTTITFELGTTTGSAAGVSFECKLTSGWAPCTSPVSYTSLPDGTYLFSVRVTGETVSASWEFIKDTHPPVVSVSGHLPVPTSGTNALSGSTTASSFATLDFSAQDITTVSFTCSLTQTVLNSNSRNDSILAGTLVTKPRSSGIPFNCTSPLYIPEMLPGQWQFEVVAKDAAGNVAMPMTQSWTVALPPSTPTLRLTSGPALFVPRTAMQFEFVAFGLQATSSSNSECYLVPGGTWGVGVSNTNTASPWSPCTSPVSYPSLSTDGNYTFAARLVGDASTVAPSTGALPESWAVSVFTVDGTPPVVNITSGPSNGQALDVSTVTVQFAINKPGSTATCELQSIDVPGESIPPTPCVSPVVFPNLTSGHFRVSIVPIDVVGNVGSPAQVEFLVDTVPPVITDAHATVDVSAASLTVTFNASDGALGSGVHNTTCKVYPVALSPAVAATVDPNSGKYQPTLCTSPYTFQPLEEGHWSVTIVAYDNVGHASLPTSLNAWLDTVAPEANVTAGPSRVGNNPGGTVSFGLVDGTDPGNTGWGAPVQWQGLLVPINASQVQEYNAAWSGSSIGASNPSNLSPSPPTGPPPMIGVTTYPPSPPPGTGSSNLGSNVSSIRSYENTLRASSSSSSSSALGSGDLGKWSNCSSAPGGSQYCTYQGLAGGTYAFQARGIDMAGNQGQPSAPYPFELQGASGSSALPTWALVSIIVGSVVGGLLLIGALLLFVRSMTRRRRREAKIANPPQFLATGSAARPMNGNGNPMMVYGVSSPREDQEMAMALEASRQQDVVERQRRQYQEQQQQMQWAAAARNDEEAQIQAAIRASLQDDGVQNWHGNPFLRQF